MWSYEYLYLTCFCLFQSHNLASIFVPTKAKLLIIGMVYFRGGEVISLDINSKKVCSLSSYTPFLLLYLGDFIDWLSE